MRAWEAGSNRAPRRGGATSSNTWYSKAPASTRRARKSSARSRGSAPNTMPKRDTRGPVSTHGFRHPEQRWPSASSETCSRSRSARLRRSDAKGKSFWRKSRGPRIPPTDGSSAPPAPPSGPDIASDARSREPSPPSNGRMRTRCSTSIAGTIRRPRFSCPPQALWTTKGLLRWSARTLRNLPRGQPVGIRGTAFVRSVR